MILKLDPRHPMVWRTPTSLQFGIDPQRLRLDDVTETQERMLAALAVGVSRPGLTMIAHGEEDDLLAAVAPLLTGPLVDRIDSVALAGSGAIIEPLAQALAAAGTHVDRGARPDARPDLAILVHHYVAPPALHGAWLRRDVPHLPVITTDGGVTIGPFVEPGNGPCLLCLELHRRDADPAWPAIATQLLGRSVRQSPALVLEAAAVACRMVLHRLANGRGSAVSVRIDAATGRRDYLKWQPHPECGCRGIDLLAGTVPEPAIAGPRGTGWAGAAPGPGPR